MTNASAESCDARSFSCVESPVKLRRQQFAAGRIESGKTFSAALPREEPMTERPSSLF
jgi:hypothetical protein